MSSLRLNEVYKVTDEVPASSNVRLALGAVFKITKIDERGLCKIVVDEKHTSECTEGELISLLDKGVISQS